MKHSWKKLETMEFKKCMLVAGLVTWYVYETYMYVSTLFSQSSDFTKWTLTFQSLSFYLRFLFHCWQVAIAFCQFWNNVDMGEENRTVLTSSVAICAMFECREKKAFKAAKLNGKASTGHSFIRVVLLHTTCHPTKRIVFQHLHCYDGDDAPKLQRFTKCANGVYMSRNGTPRVTNDELLNGLVTIIHKFSLRASNSKLAEPSHWSCAYTCVQLFEHERANARAF